MKVGLFVCDHVIEEYQAEFGDYPIMFAELFPDYEFVLFDVINGHFPENLDECNVYMATGSKFSVYDDEKWIHDLKEIIRQLYIKDKYFVGFCFGHQLIGEALGGKVQKSNQGWCVGVHKFQIVEKKSWMQPEKPSINLLMMCQDQILELPENAILLGTNEDCPNAIIQVGRKILGIQAHPEFTANYDQKLMEMRVERIGKEKIDAGLESLKLEIDKFLIQRWVTQFLSQDLTIE